MNKGSDIRAAFVALLRSIDLLVSALDRDPKRIIEHLPGAADLYSRIYDLETPSLLVVFDGIESRGGMEFRENLFRIPFKYSGESDEIYRLVTEGIPSSGDGMNMFHTEPLPGLHSMEPPKLTRVTVPLADGVNLEWWEITTSFVDRL